MTTHHSHVMAQVPGPRMRRAAAGVAAEGILLAARSRGGCRMLHATSLSMVVVNVPQQRALHSQGLLLLPRPLRLLCHVVWLRRCHGQGSMLMPQINHPGRGGRGGSQGFMLMPQISKPQEQGEAGAQSSLAVMDRPACQVVNPRPVPFRRRRPYGSVFPAPVSDVYPTGEYSLWE